MKPTLRIALPAVALGGALGALARWWLGDEFPGTANGFPWTVFWINVTGAALLGLLPALGPVRRSNWMPVFIGTGVLGGFTTMSTASVQTVSLLEAGRGGTAITYVVATLIAVIGAVWLVDRFSAPIDRVALEVDEADE